MKCHDYFLTDLSFEIGCDLTTMVDGMSKASSIDLLDCYGPTNRLIKLLEKIPEPTIKDREELNHYRAKKNCLYIELQKRLRAFDVFKRRLDEDETIRQEFTYTWVGKQSI